MRLSEILTEDTDVNVPENKRRKPNVNEEKYIHWSDDSNAYLCIITTGKLKVPRQREFSVTYYGSKEDAMKAAVEWRDEMLVELGIPLTKPYVKAMHLSKPEDLIGLTLVKKMDKGTSYYGWQVSLGETKKKTFWVGRSNSYEQAYQKAREEREAHTGLKYREVPPSFESMLAMRDEWKEPKYVEQLPAPPAETFKSLLNTIPGIYLSLRSGLPADDINSYDWVACLDPVPTRGMKKKSIGVRRNGWQEGYAKCVAIRNQVSDFEYPEQAPTFEDMLALRPKVPEKRPNYKR